jgi:hypothetical protein
MHLIEYFCVVKIDPQDRPCRYGSLSMYKSPCNKCDVRRRNNSYERPSHWQPIRRPTLRKRQTRAANKRSTARNPRPKLAKRKLRAA